MVLPNASSSSRSSNCRADHGRELEHLGGRGCETGKPVMGDLAHAVGAADRVERARQPRSPVRDLDESRIAQEPPELAEEKRYAVGERVDGGCESRDGAGVARTRQVSNQLRHVLVVQSRKRQAGHAVDSCETGKRFGELRSHVLAPVAMRRQQKQPGTGLRGSSGELEEETHRRCVGPVEVVDDQEHWTLSADASQELDHRAVESTPFGLGVAGRGSGAGLSSGRIRASSASSCAETARESRRVGHPHQELERFHERLVRRVDYGVRASVEHERPALCRSAGELTHEPCLAAACLPGDHGDLPAFTFFRETDQRAENASSRSRPTNGKGDETRSGAGSKISSPNRGGDRDERRVVGEDRPFELAQALARLDAELVQRGMRVVVGLERLGLPA